LALVQVLIPIPYDGISFVFNGALLFIWQQSVPRLSGEFFSQNQDNLGLHEAGARSCNQASLAKLKDRYVINY
jgi:hypothetical protein